MNIPSPEQVELERVMIEMEDEVDFAEIRRDADRVRAGDFPGHGPENCEQ